MKRKLPKDIVNLLREDLYKVFTKTTATRNGIVLSYHRVRGLYFLAVVFAATIGIYVTVAYLI